MRLAAAVGLVTIVTLWACHAAGEHKETVMTGQAFSCDRAAEILGYPGAKTTCDQLLPDFYWITLGGRTVPGGSLQTQIVVENGKISDKGNAAAGRWLARAKILDHKAAQAFHVARALAALDALPAGFDAERVSGSMPEYGVAAGLAFDPFTLTLGTLWYQEPGGPRVTRTGDTPPRPARAILRGTADYHFTWTVEKLVDGKTWTKVRDTALE
jgi:hypothetical protein